MSLTVIDFSQSLATWLAGDGAALNVDITSGTVSPNPPTWANLMRSLGQALYGAGRGTALSVKGRASNTDGAVADIVAGTDGHVLRRSGTAVGFGTLAAGALATGPGVVTPAMLDNGSARSLLGRSANSSGARADIAGGGADTLAHDNGTSIAFRSVDSVIANASRWTTVRDVDCGLWASTDFAAAGDGTPSLDDGGGALTWITESTANANGSPGFFRRNASDVGDDGGPGVRIHTDASVSATLSSSAQTAPRIGIPLSSLDPNYDESQEYIALLHVTRFLETGTISGTPRLFFGLYGAVNSPGGVAARTLAACLLRTTAPNAVPSLSVNNGNTASAGRSDLNYNNVGTGDGANVLAVQWGPSGIVTAYRGTWSSGFPAVSALRTVGKMTIDDSAPSISPINVRETRLTVSVLSTASFTGQINCMFRNIRLMRRVR